MAYVGLYLAVRSGDWQLRVASMKMMAPVFTAFDHPSYQRLISQQLADILCMPPAMLAMLKQGAFTVSISGRPWYSVGIDEAHEMLINKACKTSIVTPTQLYKQHCSLYTVPNENSNIKLNFFPQSKHSQKPIESPFSSCPNDKEHKQNVQAEMDLIKAKALFALDTTNRGLINPFTDKIATPQQSNDLLSFRSR